MLDIRMASILFKNDSWSNQAALLMGHLHRFSNWYGNSTYSSQEVIGKNAKSFLSDQH